MVLVTLSMSMMTVITVMTVAVMTVAVMTETGMTVKVMTVMTVTVMTVMAVMTVTVMTVTVMTVTLMSVMSIKSDLPVLRVVEDVIEGFWTDIREYRLQSDHPENKAARMSGEYSLKLYTSHI